MKVKFILISLLLLGTILYFTLTRTRLLGALLLPCNTCEVKNELGVRVNANVYRNHLSWDGTKVNEIIIFYPENVIDKFVAVAIPEKLIGINDYGFGYKILLNHLYMNYRSLMFTPINLNFEPLVNNFSIREDLIEFETFDELEKYGSKMIVSIKGSHID